MESTPRGRALWVNEHQLAARDKGEKVPAAYSAWVSSWPANESFEQSRVRTQREADRKKALVLNLNRNLNLGLVLKYAP